MSNDESINAELSVSNELGAYTPLSPAMVNESTGAMSVALARAEQATCQARAAQLLWAALGVEKRLRIIERFRQLLFAERATVARTISEESGKPLSEAMTADVAVTLEGARYLVRRAKRRLAPHRERSQVMAAWRKIITTHYEPYGVVAVVSPWNYPVFLPAVQIMTALTAGNAVVFKPSEHTPKCADHIVRLLHQAGVPPDVLQLLHGDRHVGAAVVSANVDKVFFTGSERTGRAIAMACAPRFVPVSLELGGSDAAIVCEDADIAVAASGITWGRFANAGQTCAAVKRVIAVGAAYEPLLAALTHSVSGLVVGAMSSCDVGPMISAAQRASVMDQLNEALSGGATVHVRAELRAGSAEKSERLMAAVVLTNVTPEMRVWNEEVFGPVLVVVRADSERAAIALANHSRYGLSASVWSRDRARGARVAAELQVGAVTLNDAVTAAGLPEAAHGGVKASGMGRTHGAEGLMACVRTRTVVDDRLPSQRQPWWFGYGRDSASHVDGYLRLTHGATWLERLGGFPGMLRLLFRPERPL